MALTLTQTAKITKRAFALFLVFIFLSILSFTGYKIYYYQYYLPRQPKPVILPEVKFGALPLPAFPQSTASANLSYTLATPTGNLPTNIPNIVKVYFVNQLGTTLTAPDNARALATSLSFTNGPQILNSTQYQFTDDNGGTLNIDLDSGNFSFSKTASTSGVLYDPILPDETTLVTNFRNFLGAKELLKDDLKNGRSKVTYDQASQNQSATATISIWPADLDSYQIVTPTFDSGLITGVAGKAKDDLDRYLKLNYNYWSPDPNTTSTYPIIAPDQAFTNLKNGEAAIIKTPPNTSNIPITSITLAYFESTQYTPYIEPVYLFQGDNFVAYVAAIDPKYLTK